MELSGMNSQGYVLTSELDKGLKKYGEDNNLSPSFILNVFLISFGITILPKSSILLTTPVAFNFLPPHF